MTEPRANARLAGVVYLFAGLGGAFAEIFVRGKLVVWRDGAATVANILANESLFRLGGAGDLIGFCCDAALALLFYELFKSVNKSLALMAAFFRLMHVAILATATVNHFGALIYAKAANDAQALVSLRLHAAGYNIGLLFFGVSCLLLGILIYKSGFLPRLIGVWMGAAGLAYVANSFVHLLAPRYGAQFFSIVLVPCGIGELLLILWLLVMGVNSQRWNERACYVQ